MKNLFLLNSLVFVSFISMQSTTLAHDGWFNKYDRDHDRQWNYEEFARAQREWQIAHHEHVMSEKELRDYYKRYDKDHNGSWATEEANRFHPW